MSSGIDHDEGLGFTFYLDYESGARGDKGEWFQPISFLFRDQGRSTYSLDKRLEAFKQDHFPLSSGQWNSLSNI